MYGERLFQRPKKRFRGEIIAFFATVLVEMDSGNVDTRNA